MKAARADMMDVDGGDGVAGASASDTAAAGAEEELVRGLGGGGRHDGPRRGPHASDGAAARGAEEELVRGGGGRGGLMGMAADQCGGQWEPPLAAHGWAGGEL